MPPFSGGRIARRKAGDAGRHRASSSYSAPVGFVLWGAMHERGEGRAERLVEQLRSGGLRCRLVLVLVRFVAGAVVAGAVVPGVVVASLAGCDGPSNAGAAQSEPAKPQQLVQRIEPAPAAPAGNVRA